MDQRADMNRKQRKAEQKKKRGQKRIARILFQQWKRDNAGKQ
jgi:hypothetical protein